MCAASKLVLSITPAETVQGAGLPEPFSKPGLPNNCCVVPPPLAVTVKLIVAEWVLLPPEPLTTTLYAPALADAPTEIVTVDEPDPGAAIDVGLKVAVAPAGKPAAESATTELKLPDIVVVIVDAPEVPAVTVKAVGAETMAKSAGVPPEVWTLRAKSSTTKEVFKL